MEVYYALMRDGGPLQKAREVVSSFEPILIDFTFEEILDAMDMRVRWSRKRARISYVDAISYHLAQRRRLLFLTGDPAFKGLSRVTFIRIPHD
jgi:predicted nucleic acid-binding protein